MQFVLGILAIILVVYCIVYIIAGVFVALQFISGNGIVLLEKLLGSWAFVSPVFSWVIMGFILGTLLHFALLEAHNLNRPAIKTALVLACIALVLLTPAVGPSSQGLGSDVLGLFKKSASFTSKGPSVQTPSSESSVTTNIYRCIAPRGVTLRSGPSGDHPIIGAIASGEEVELLANETANKGGELRYIKVRTHSGKIGFAWIGEKDVNFSVAN